MENDALSNGRVPHQLEQRFRNERPSDRSKKGNFSRLAKCILSMHTVYIEIQKKIMDIDVPIHSYNNKHKKNGHEIQ